jgi:hypothetical protein
MKNQSGRPSGQHKPPWLLALLFLVPMASCSTMVEEIGPDNEGEEPQSAYFPLQVGNRWTYRKITPNRDIVTSTRVFGTSEIDGYRYFLFDRPGSPDYLRADEQGNVWRYHRRQQRPWFLFDLEDGAIYMTPDSSVSSYTVTVTRGIRIDSPAGTFEDCVRLEFDVVGAVDDEFTLTFAPAVGIVHRWSPWRPNEVFMDYVLASGTGGSP